MTSIKRWSYLGKHPFTPTYDSGLCFDIRKFTSIDPDGSFCLPGYEIIGLEKVPDQGPALLVYYHGALPIDMYYIIAKMLLYKKRSLKNVVATFLFRFPGNLLLSVFIVPNTHNYMQ